MVYKPEKIKEEIRKIVSGFSKLRFFKLEHVVLIINRFQRREKIFFFSLLALFFLNFFLTSFAFYLDRTEATPAHGGTYTEGMIGAPRYINPILAQSQTDKDLVKLVFAGLYKYDGKGNFLSDIAASGLQISTDQKQYTISLKPNLKWHDGRPITADDVVFTIETLQNPDYQSPLRSQWQGIRVEKVDELTVTFINRSISAPFLTNLTLGILPKHIWSNISAAEFQLSKFNLEAVGSGPYFVKEINKSIDREITSVALESYSNYSTGKAFIEQIICKFYPNTDEALFALRTKDVEGLGFIPSEKKAYVDAKRNLNVLKIPTNEYQALFFNLTRTSKVLGDRNVRQALATALNRQNFIDTVFSGLAKPTHGPIMPGQIGYNQDVEKVNQYNVTAANELLEKSGWTRNPETGIRNKGNVLLQFTITVNDFVFNVEGAKNLKEQWKQIGADVNVNVVPTTDFAAQYIRPRNFDALLFIESTGADPDPFVFWHSSQSQDPGFNIAQYKNTMVDRLISEGRSTLNASERREKYKEFQYLISIDLPAIFINQSYFVYEQNPKIKGVAIETLANPENRFYDVSHWYIQTQRIWK